MKHYSLLLLLPVLALTSCSKDSAPAPPAPPEAAFVYTLDGQVYTAAAIGMKEVVIPNGISFYSTPLPVTVNGVRYQDQVSVTFSPIGSGQYALKQLSLYRVDERGQPKGWTFSTNAAATAKSIGGVLWSGTFAGQSTDAQGQVVSTLSNGSFDYVRLK